MPPPLDSMTPPASRVPRLLAVWTGLALAIGAVVLRAHYVQHAGALWRDEIDSVNVAARASLGDVLRHAHLDSFPLAWVSSLHMWIASGLGADDAGIRRFGLLIGVATVGVVWWSGRRLAGRTPLVALLLLGASPTMIVYGSEVRGYGLAALAVAWCMAAFWTYSTRPTATTAVVAGIAGLLTVQTYYANAFVLLAIGTGAAAVAARHRRWTTVAGVIGLGAIAGLSLVAEWASMVSAARDTAIDQGPYSLASRFAMFREALAPELPLLAGCWAAAVGAGAVGWIVGLTGHGDEGDRALFASTIVIATGPAFALYLGLVARVSTQHWYYLSPMTVLALAIEMGVTTLTRRAAWAEIAATSLVAIVLAAGPLASLVRVRMTNVDVIARGLASDAHATDLVVVLPWYCATSFERYYRGTTPWIALPDVHFTDTARPHGQVAERMTRGDAGVRDELARIEATLRAGGRVWIVGQPLIPRQGESVPRLAEAPHGPEGWALGPYLEGWAFQLGALMQAGARDVWKIDLPDVGPVNPHENLPLFQLEGWR